MGPYNTVTGNHYIYNHGPEYNVVTDKDHWFDMSIRDLTWATVATKLATLPPIFGGLICLSCPLVCVLLSTYCVWPTSLGQPSLEKILK